jgi:putative tricarboxylic transport membrane protein
LPYRAEPRIVPAGIGIVQILIGVWYAVEIVKFHRWGQNPAVHCDTEKATPEAWIPLSAFGLGLLAYTLLIHRSGFVIASAVLLALTAFGMGSRRTMRDVSLAVALSAGIFLVLDTWLGFQLPEGWLAGLM